MINFIRIAAIVAALTLIASALFTTPAAASNNKHCYVDGGWKFENGKTHCEARGGIWSPTQTLPSSGPSQSQVDAIGALADSNEGRISTVESQLGGLTNEVRGRDAATNGRIDGLEGRVTTAESEIERLDAEDMRFHGATVDGDTMTVTVGDFAKSRGRSEIYTKEVTVDVSELNQAAEVADLQGRMSTREMVDRTHHNRISRVETSTATNADEIDVLEGRVSTTETVATSAKNIAEANQYFLNEGVVPAINDHNQRINTNTFTIANNDLRINGVAHDLYVNVMPQVELNEENIAANAKAIETNVANIEANRQSTIVNAANISANAITIEGLSFEMEELSDQVDKYYNRSRAAAAAAASLTLAGNSCGASMGVAANVAAFAAGCSKQVDKNMSVNFNTTLLSNGDGALGAGVNFRW